MSVKLSNLSLSFIFVISDNFINISYLSIFSCVVVNNLLSLSSNSFVMSLGSEDTSFEAIFGLDFYRKIFETAPITILAI